MPKSREQLNKSVLESVSSESQEENTYEAEVVLSPELDSLSNTLNEVQEAIDTDQNLVAGDLLALKEVVGNIKVDIGGEEFSLDEIGDDEELKRNMDIWKEMEAGDFSNTHKLTLLSKKAKEMIANYTGENLHLSGITSAKDLKLPDSIGGDLYLSSLTSAKDLNLPDSIGGFLDLGGLESAKDLKLSDSIGGGLMLRSLTSAKNLKLPDFIGDDLFLGSLISAEHLILPNSIGGDIFLRSLTSVEKDKLKKKYPQHARKIN
jgi:hypothetical protein